MSNTRARPQVRGANVLVTPAGAVRIVDFGHAVVGASQADMAQDMAELNDLLTDPGWRGAQTGPSSTTNTTNTTRGPTPPAALPAGGSHNDIMAPGSRLVGGCSSYSASRVAGSGRGGTHPRGPPPLRGVREVCTQRAPRALRGRLLAGVGPAPCRSVARSTHRVVL